MKQFISLSWNRDAITRELLEFVSFLESNPTGEMAEIWPRFQQWSQLCAMIAIAHGVFPDSIALQYDVFGTFTTNIVIANKREKRYFFIELEGAKPGSLFRKTERATTIWGTGISAAFYQMVDWFWKLDDESMTEDFRERFGDRGAEISGIIVVGRNVDVEETDRRRLNWMNGKLRIDSRQVIVYTYEDLQSLLEEKLKLIEKFAKSKE